MSAFRKPWLRAAVTLYRGALVLYPRPFRDAYGEEMVSLFRARVERAAGRGVFAALVTTVRALFDAGLTALSERLKRPRRAKARGQGPLRRTGDGWIFRLSSALRLGLRSLARQPALVTSVVSTLTLGTGVTLAFVTLADTAILRPLPYPAPERLVSIVQSDPRFGLVPFGPPYLIDLRERTESFELIAGFSPSWRLRFLGPDQPRSVIAAYVTDGLLDLVGTSVLTGRGFTPDEYEPGAERVALVTRSFWNRHFGAEARFAERPIRLEQDLYTVVGLLPSELRLPITTSAVSSRNAAAEIYLPFATNPYFASRQIPVMNVVGRLKDGTSLSLAEAELGAIGDSLAEDYPDTSSSEVTGVPLRELVTRESRGTLWMLLGASVFLLLIACANVASLLLARVEERRTEMAVRLSLGARRGQMMRQLLVESGLLALAGSAGGLALAWALLDAVPALGLTALPPSASVTMNPRVAVAALLLSVTTVLLFGLAPALHATRRGARDGTSPLLGARSVTTGTRARSFLVTAEIAVAMALLIGAGLLGRSFLNLIRVDPGFRVEGLLGVPIDLSADTYGAPERRVFVEEILRRFEASPTVSAAAAVNRLPFSGGNVFVGVEVEGAETRSENAPVVDRRVVSPGYFATMGIPILEGRDVSRLDTAESPSVAIINVAMAERFWPEGAVGRRARLQLRSGPGPWLTIIGVAGNVRHHGLDTSPEPELYVPYAQAAVETLVAVVRTSTDPLTLVPGLRETVWELDATLPLDGIGTVSQLVEQSVAEPRLRMLLLNGFGAMALLLAAVGVYGVTTYSVACRTKEIGLRMALGAEASGVVRLIVGRGMAQTLWGVAIGLAAAGLVSRSLERLLFGVTPTDVTTFALSATVLAVVAALACYVPARRATRVDPVDTLRM